MPLDKAETRELQIAFAFLQGLQTFQSTVRPLLDTLDETERRARIAEVFPAFADSIEGHTREELEIELQSITISLAVGKAIVWAETNPGH